MAATPANVAAIAALRARGLSYRAIERELGLAGSGRMVKYAAESKPAPNLTAALQALVRGERPPAIARRTTTAGTPAAVRQPVLRIPGTEAAQVEVRSPRSRTFATQLLRAARGMGQQVQLMLTFRSGRKYGRPRTAPMEVELFGKGGWNAANVVAFLQQHGADFATGVGMAGALRQLALAKPGIEEVGAVVKIELGLV